MMQTALVGFEPTDAAVKVPCLDHLAIGLKYCADQYIDNNINSILGGK